MPLVARRSTPSAKRDYDAFPIRIKFAVSADGMGRDLDAMLAWLRTNLPRQACAIHSARSIGGDAMAVHFLTIDDAVRFLESFPDVPLAVPGG